MNISNIAVIRLEARVWDSDHIPANELAQLIAEQNQLRGARVKAAAILRSARQERRALLLHSRQQSAMEQEREIVELRALLQQDTRQAVEEAVVWLVNEQRMEQQIARSLQAKAVEWAVDTLKAWGGSLDWEKVMADRVNELSRQQSDIGTLVLYVHPDSLEKVTAALSITSGLRVDVDTSLLPHQALLESALMRIDIDLDKQFDLIIEQLGTRLSWDENNLAESHSGNSLEGLHDGSE